MRKGEGGSGRGRGGERGIRGGRVEWGGVKGEREGRENRIITTAHRFWFGWSVDCRILACLQIDKERNLVE